MTLRHFRIFIAVYEEKSMTAAAKKLIITQPSVSQAIRELEDYYHVSLFERLSGKLYVTGAGEKLYEYAVHIHRLCDDVKDILGIASEQKKLTIGANYTAGSVLIHKYIESYRNAYPNSEVKVHVNKASVLIQMLRNNELDFALMEEIRTEDDLIQDYFYDDRIIVVVSPRHKLAAKGSILPEDIVKEQLLLRETGAGVRNLFEIRLKQLGLSIKPYWESTSTTALINAARNNMGVAVLPYQLVRDRIEAGELKEVKIKSLDLSRKLAVTYHRNKLLTDAMKAFIGICHEIS